MSTAKHGIRHSRRAEPGGGHRRDAIRRGLLAAGPLSSLLYVVATDGVAAFRWDGYRRSEQMVSELFAVGSPGRDVLFPFTWFYTLLFVAFGVGVWNSVRGNRALRIGGGLLMAAPGPNLVLGVGERISIGAFLLWVGVLAVVLWKRPVTGSKDARP